jgi:hypothetical protein
VANFWGVAANENGASNAKKRKVVPILMAENDGNLGNFGMKLLLTISLLS